MMKLLSFVLGLLPSCATSRGGENQSAGTDDLQDVAIDVNQDGYSDLVTVHLNLRREGLKYGVGPIEIRDIQFGTKEGKYERLSNPVFQARTYAAPAGGISQFQVGQTISSCSEYSLVGGTIESLSIKVSGEVLGGSGSKAMRISAAKTNIEESQREKTRPGALVEIHKERESRGKTFKESIMVYLTFQLEMKFKGYDQILDVYEPLIVCFNIDDFMSGKWVGKALNAPRSKRE